MPAAEQEGRRRRPLTAGDITHVRLLSGVAVDAAGRCAYVVESRLDADTGSSRSEMLRVDLATGQVDLAPVTNVAPWRAAVHPGGGGVALVAGAVGSRQIWWWDTVTGGAEPLGQTGGDVCGPPSWAPDGSRLVCPVRVPSYVQPRAGFGAAHLLTDTVYKIDGLPIGVHEAPSRLTVLTLADGTCTDLTGPGGQVADCTWSPDGRHIAFLSDRHREVGAGLPSALWVVAAKGGEPRRLTDGCGLVAAPAWDPTGRAIAYIGNDDYAYHGPNREVRVVTLDEEETVCATAALDVSVGVCVQSDDVRGYGDATLRWSSVDRVLCTFPVGGTVRLAEITVHERAASVDAVPCLFDGAGAVLSFDASADGSVVAGVLTDPTSPGELHLLSRGGGVPRRVTGRNDGWLSEIELAGTERMTVGTADGSMVDAWVVRPHESTPGPVVIAVHGGPHWPCGWRFSFEHQRLAALGYAVVMANPRGAQGYGQAYSTSIHADWGNLDRDDVVAVIDAVERQPWADRDRMALTGVSYGGFLAGWLLGETDRFRAAVLENAVLDFVSYFGGTSDGGAFAAAELGGTPWDNPAFFRDRSPLARAHLITTPVLLVHGELDHDCPIGQSEQLYATLQHLERDVEMLRIPGEGHGMVLLGTLDHRRQRWAAVDDFLERQLS